MLGLFEFVGLGLALCVDVCVWPGCVCGGGGCRGVEGGGRVRAQQNVCAASKPPPCPVTDPPQHRQGELPARERLCKYAREHVLLKDNELYEDDTDNAGD